MFSPHGKKRIQTCRVVTTVTYIGFDVVKCLSLINANKSLL